MLKGLSFKQADSAGGPMVFWEPRTVVGALQLPGYLRQLNKWLERRLASTEMTVFLYGFLGCDPLDFRSSLRAAQCRSVAPGRLKWLRSETMMSTSMFLGFLVRLPQVLRKENKEMAASLLSQVVNAWLPANLQASPFLADDLCGVCPARAGALGSPCMHCDRLVRLYLSREGSIDASAVVAILQSLASSRQCPAMGAWLKRIIHTIARIVDAKVRTKQFQGSVLGTPSPSGKVRKRRLDAELKHECLDSVAKNKYKNSSSAARSGKLQMSRRTARRCEGLLMRQYLCSGYARLSGAQGLHIAFDGATFGGEQTVLFPVWSHEAGVGFWAPPQARHRCPHVSLHDVCTALPGGARHQNRRRADTDYGLIPPDSPHEYVFDLAALLRGG